MKTPPIPSNENERIAALKEYQILDTLPEQAYDDITKIASQICGTPIALVSLIDEDRQWFKSHHGLGVSETPKDLAYCAHAINEPNKIMEVSDAFKDERFHDNPLATGDPHVVFYAGAPLTDDEGHTLGTLCVIDHKEKHLNQDQKDALWALSRQVVALLQLRKENLKRTQIDKDFNTLVENLGDGVFELDENGKCIYANNKMLQLLNRNLEEVIDTSIWDMIYSEDVSEMQAFYGRQFKKKSEKCRYEYRLQPKDGDPIWVSQNTTMEYEGDKMVKLRSISRDISETKAMEEQLALKESHYKLVSENSTDLIALHELDGTYKFVSPSSKEILGFTPEELVGRNPYESIHPDDVNRLRQGPHQDTLEGSSIRDVEYRLKRKDGSYVWMQSYTNPIQNDQGEVIAFQTSSRNISYRKREEQKIQKHLEGLTLLNELASMPSSDKSILSEAIQKVTKHLGMDVGIIGQINDDKFTIINHFSTNKKIESLTKYPIKETCVSVSYDRDEPLLIDKEEKTQDIINHPCFPNESVNAYLSACIYKSGEKFGVIDLLGFSKKEEVFSSYNKEFLQLFANWIGSVLESQEEKELLRRARKHAEAASEAKASFLSMMSHEIRTPLNGIIGTTHLLLAKSPSEVQVPHLKVLEQSSNNLMSIVNDILDFGKIEEGKIQMDKSAFDLKELTSSIYNNYKTQGEEKGINVSYSYDESLSNFYIGDSVRISQILHNLLSNAVKFTHEGQVLIKLEKSNSHDNFDEIQFSIKDSGIGIPEEKQKGIFEVFIQADETTTRKFGGSGLGLAITKNLIELMNSEIQLESHEGFGSLFKFKLIMPRATEDSVQSSSVNEHFQSLKANILLVEDNLFNRAIAKDFLESWGCNVLEAGNGKEALDVIQKNTIDLVLLDLQMPIMDGYETIEAIRSHQSKTIASLPVVALTAAAMGDIESKVYQSGMDDFITKPFHPADFYQKLSSFLIDSEEPLENRSTESRILDKLQQTLGSDEKQIDRYFDVFVQTLKEENEVLKASIRGENFPALKAYSHKNKSSLLLGGLNELSMEAEELEEMINRKAPKTRILEKAVNHQKAIDSILEELDA